MKNLKLKLTHFGLLVIIALSIFTASCEDNPVEIDLTCADLDYIALRALYLSTDGDNWTDNTGWPTAAEFEANPNTPIGTDVSTWVGIITDANGCTKCVDMSYPGLWTSDCVIAVPGNGNNLTGNIPSEIGLLPQLTGLNLSYNHQLTGSVPPEIGNLSNLEVLCLTDNNFSGNIPPEIGNLSNLDDLFMFSSNLSGNIPPEIGNLSNLSSLYLDGNNLSGNIPPELGNIPLVDVTLENNQLTGSIPSEIGSISSLIYIGLYNNQLSGCYDSNLANLCPQLAPWNSDNITMGNNFDAPWEDFCSTGAGTCGE